ncbi:MAG: CRTAC1 family protein [Phycisphaerales bacterium]|nr:CRTAC1 family protein [Phycisphaerales bacterium]
MPVPTSMLVILAVTQTPRIVLTDVTDASGIAMTTISGTRPHTQILEVNGSGLGLIDYDGDDDLDLFVANGATLDDPEHGPGCRLYRNLGDLRFEDVTAAAGIDVHRWTMGVAVGDADGDGRDDLYLTCFGPNILLRNAGDGTFTDVTAAAGVGDPGWGTGCAFGDLDADGDLDLYVVNYVAFDPTHPPPPAEFKGVTVLAGPKGLAAAPDVLYENQGDGTFLDVSESSGCRAVMPSFGLGVLICDLDGNGTQDILVGNDSQKNFLFERQADGRFKDVGLRRGIATNMEGSEQATMGIAVADVDDNGRPDVFSTNFSSDTNTLLLNKGRFFDDGTSRFGLSMISRPYLGWACSFVDLDRDGDEDLIMFNGHVYPQASRQTMDSEYEQPPLLFERSGDRFERIDDPDAFGMLGGAYRTRAAVWADLDRDGDVDMIVSEIDGPVRVIRNDSPPQGPWLIVELDDNRPGARNRRGLGARIEVDMPRSTRKRTRWLATGGSFQSANPPAAHFGFAAGELGPAPEQTVGLTVTWPDGGATKPTDVPVNRRIAVQRDAFRVIDAD